MSYSLKRSFPEVRMRRRRQAGWALDLFAETSLKPSDLILPLFVTEGAEIDVAGMPNVKHHKLDSLVAVASNAYVSGIRAIMLFPIVKSEFKTERGEHAYAPDNLIAKAIKLLKENIPELAIIADVALDPYTTHGHDGIIDSLGYVLNDATNEILCQQALMLTEAGADVIAPSDMMDGRVAAIRKALDAAGLVNVMLLAYAAKFNSKLYGPFRGAIGSQANLGKANKSGYQQDVRNIDEAMHEIALDISEGADWILIKPGMLYLDVIARAKSAFCMPIAAYQVSGEYSMLAAYANNFQLDFLEIQLEALHGFKRAGAMHIVCYNAIHMAQKIKLS